MLAAAAFAGPSQAAVYTGVWDAPFGSPFTSLGWKGTADFFVPDSCVPAGTADLNNTTACAGGAIVTAAQVQLYDTNDPGQATLSTMVFNPLSLHIDTLRFVSGELTRLITTVSNPVDPAEDLLVPFGVSATTGFGLYFSMDGPRLAWQECGLAVPCVEGANDPNYPSNLTISRSLPEPGTLALAGLALLALAPRRLRRRPLG